MNNKIKLSTLLGSLVLSVACATVPKEVSDLQLEERVRIKTTVTKNGAIRTDFSDVKGVPIKIEIQSKGMMGDYTLRVTYDKRGNPKEKIIDGGYRPALWTTTYVTDDQGNILEEKELVDKSPRDGIPEDIEILTYKPGCKKNVIDEGMGVIPAGCFIERSFLGSLSDTGEVHVGSLDTYGSIEKDGKTHIIDRDHIEEGKLESRRDGESRDSGILYTKEFSFY